MPAAADVCTTNASNTPERADIADALVQLRLIAHIEKRSRSEVGSSRAAAQSAALAEEVESVRAGNVKIRGFRRVATDGFFGSLLASERPCCRKECPCMGCGMSAAHEFAKGEASSFTKFKRIHQVDPLTAVAPTPSSRGALAHEGALLGSKAKHRRQIGNWNSKR